MEKHYTLLKAAQLLGVTTQTLRNWDNAGKIRAIRTPGNQRRIPESEIARLVSPVEGNYVRTETEPQRSIAEISTIDEKMQKKEEESVENTVELPSIIQEKEDYLLMCKDTAVYDISQEKIINESLLPGCLLKETISFSQWMETRYSKETNFSSQRLMQRAFGSVSHEHAAFVTGAHSLSDCYWIKRQDEDIQFLEVTPYFHM